MHMRRSSASDRLTKTSAGASSGRGFERADQVKTTAARSGGAQVHRVQVQGLRLTENPFAGRGGATPGRLTGGNRAGVRGSTALHSGPANGRRRPNGAATTDSDTNINAETQKTDSSIEPVLTRDEKVIRENGLEQSVADFVISTALGANDAQSAEKVKYQGSQYALGDLANKLWHEELGPRTSNNTESSGREGKRPEPLYTPQSRVDYPDGTSVRADEFLAKAKRGQLGDPNTKVTYAGEEYTIRHLVDMLARQTRQSSSAHYKEDVRDLTW